jgi:hypothetical protein
MFMVQILSRSLSLGHESGLLRILMVLVIFSILKVLGYENQIHFALLFHIVTTLE